MKKSMIVLCAGLSILLFLQGACTHDCGPVVDMKNDTTPSTFSSMADAVAKAQTDLIEVVRRDQGLQLGIADSSALKEATAGTPVRRFTLDFDKLLSADSATTLRGLVTTEGNTIVPLVHEGRLLTVVELGHRGDQWNVAALAGSALADDLRTVMAASADNAARGEIALYEIPNLSAKLFAVSSAQGEMIYTNYNDFSLRQGVPARELIGLLRQHAQTFQKEFGDQVKKQRLVE